MHPAALQSAIVAHKAGTLRPRQMDDDGASVRERQTVGIVEHKRARIAVMHVSGSMGKRLGKYTDFSTAIARNTVRELNRTGAADVIAMVIDSMGGQADGMDDFVSDLKASAIPVHAFVSDSGYSAGYYAATGAKTISMNRAGGVGSIGTIAVLEDSSGAYEAQGIVVKVYATGDLKGIGVDGAAITDEQDIEMQKWVAMFNRFFVDSVRTARKLDDGAMELVQRAGVYGSDEALKLGLVDFVETEDQFIDRIVKSTRVPRTDVARRKVALGQVDPRQVRRV